MFNQLFFRSDALTRQLAAPLVDERRQYLTLADHPNDTISLPEIKKAASRWSSHNWPSPESSPAKRSREYFIAQRAGWLTFLNRLQTVPEPVTVCGRMLGEFRSFMQRGK